MKKILVLLTILVSVPAFSQSADERIGAFLNQADWFGLEKNYPILKDSMQADFLKLMSEALIGYYFNRPDEALQSIHKLLVNHQAEIGGQNALGTTQTAKCRTRNVQKPRRYLLFLRSVEEHSGSGHHMSARGYHHSRRYRESEITDKHRAQRMARYDNSNTCDHKRKNLSIYFRYRSRNKLHVATHG